MGMRKINIAYWFYGAGETNRTLDLLITKTKENGEFYNLLFLLVGPVGLEPTTKGLWAAPGHFYAVWRSLLFF